MNAKSSVDPTFFLPALLFANCALAYWGFSEYTNRGSLFFSNQTPEWIALLAIAISLFGFAAICFVIVKRINSRK